MSTKRNFHKSMLTRFALAASLACSALATMPAQAQSSAPPSPVETAAAEQRELRPTVTATGEVRSRSGADVAAGVQGRLESVLEPGSWVEAGAVIAHMDAEELALQQLEQSARVKRGEVALRQAERELQRLQDSGNAVSRYDRDQARNSRDLAASDLDIARAALQLTQERLSRADLRAPFAGIIAERLRMPGEEVARGEPIVRLQNLDELEIRLYLPLRHVRTIRPGSEVTLRLDETRTLATKVRAIVPVGDSRSQRFEALIDVPDDLEVLAIGRSVEVELPLQAATRTVAVPRDALVVRAEGTAVFRVHDGVAERVPVQPGIAENDWVAVGDALQANDRVVVRGAETLRDGASVTVVGDDEVRLSAGTRMPARG